jgi:EAL domain-containing protein (putative c-di-GMP-specific phosphodiesterase class I)
MREINNRFGYLAADKVLEDFALKIAHIARKEDKLFTINGTYYALLIKNPRHSDHMLLAAQKIALESAIPTRMGMEKAWLKVHLGLSQVSNAETGAEDLLLQAEIALQSARKGIKPFVQFKESLNTNHAKSGYSWLEIDYGLENGQFEVFYQPVVDIRNDKTVGAEALIRWNKPDSGLIGPNLFLTDNESMRGARSIANFVLNAALRQASEWMKIDPDFSIAINLSPSNLEDHDLIELVNSALRLWNFPPEKLTLEITETALMDDVSLCLSMLRNLRSLGIKVAIDDFGTGYSSLSYLKDLPADILKIDQSFIIGMPTSERNQKIIAAIIQLADAVDLDVVAEGIEEHESLKMLLDLGCKKGQGFIYSPPLCATEFTSLLNPDEQDSESSNTYEPATS